MQFLSDRRVIFLSRLLLGGLFIYASFDKALNPLAFAQNIHNYRVTPPSLINFAAVILPWIELLAGLLIIAGFKVRGANLVLGGLLVFYIVLLSVTAARGININCGCFSTSDTVRSNLLVVIARDVVFLLLSLHLFFFYRPTRHSPAAA
jgi:uncharacterized membrane protein YphA (DoxX/SURF4 family)